MKRFCFYRMEACNNMNLIRDSTSLDRGDLRSFTSRIIMSRCFDVWALDIPETEANDQQLIMIIKIQLSRTPRKSLT